jgi:hypothetical protein
LEHSIDSGLWTTGAAFAFGARFAAAGGPAAGGVAGGGICPNAALAHVLKTTAIINFFISAPSLLRGCYVLCTSACALATPTNAACYTSRMAKKITLEQKIDALTNIVEKGFGAVAEDISKLATKDQIIALHSRSTESRATSGLPKATS